MLKNIWIFVISISILLCNINIVHAGLIEKKYTVNLNSLPQIVSNDLNKEAEEIKSRGYHYNLNPCNSFFSDGGSIIISDGKLYIPVISKEVNSYGNIPTSKGFINYDKTFEIHYTGIKEYDGLIFNSINIKKMCIGDYGIILKKDGTVSAWGDNDSGQLGNGTTITSNNISNVIGLSDVIDVSGAMGTSLAVKSDGTVYGWGSDNCILGLETEKFSVVPIKIEGLNNVKRVEVGHNMGVALKNDGTVWVFGNRNIYGNSSMDYSPMQVLGFDNIVDISCKNRHIVAIDEEGNVYTWGENKNGELGNGSDIISDFAYKVNITDVKKVIAGNNLTLALKNDGTLYGWGDNNFGQLGNGTRIDQYLPVQVNLAEKIVDIGKDTFIEDYSYALSENGNVYFWGTGNKGDLINSNNVHTLPIKITDDVYVVDGDTYKYSLDKKETVLTLNDSNYTCYMNLFIDENNFDDSYIAASKFFELVGYSVTKSSDGERVIISNGEYEIVNEIGTSIYYINGIKTILQTLDSILYGEGYDESDWYYLPIGAMKTLLGTGDITWNSYMNTLNININI